MWWVLTHVINDCPNVDVLVDESILYPSGWKHTQLNSATWLTLVKFMEYNISKFWFLNLNYVRYNWEIPKKNKRNSNVGNLPFAKWWNLNSNEIFFTLLYFKWNLQNSQRWECVTNSISLASGGQNCHEICHGWICDIWCPNGPGFILNHKNRNPLGGS